MESLQVEKTLTNIITKCCITITSSIVPHKMLYHNYTINCSSQNVVSQLHHQLFLTKCCIKITPSIVPHKMLYQNYTINCSSQNVVSKLHHQLFLNQLLIRLLYHSINLHVLTMTMNCDNN